MDKRKIVLFFLASSTFSLMVFFIVYGLFIKDSNEEFIKAPQSAPVLPSSQLLVNPTPQETESSKPISVDIPKEAEPSAEKETEPKATAESTAKTEKAEPEDKAILKKKPSTTLAEHAEKEPSKTTAVTKPTEKQPVVTTTTKSVADKSKKVTTTVTTTKVPLPRIEPDSKLPLPKTTTTSTKATATLPQPPKPPTAPVASHAVYVRGFTSEKAAQEAATALQQSNPKNKAIVTHKNGQVVLQFGTFSDKTNADKLKQELKNQNINAQTD